MKVQINKDELVNALDRMYIVSTKSLMPNFDFAGKVTIEVKGSGRAVVTSSNGCLTVQQELKTNGGAEKGICTTNSVKLRDGVKGIVTESESDPIELCIDGGKLSIRDAISKRRKKVKLPIEVKNHNTKMGRPDGDSFFWESSQFNIGVRSSLPFLAKSLYPERYQAVCMHWNKKEARMVCGDGSLFSIITFPRHAKDSHKREFKRVIVANQLSLIANVFEDAEADIEMVWEGKSELWVRSGKVEILARGLPDTDYVNYESNAYRTEDARAYIDIQRSDLKEVSDLLVSMQDKIRADMGQPYSCFIKASDKSDHILFEIRKDQGRFQCEYEIPMEYHDLGDMPSFESPYAHLFFSNPVQVMRNSYLRFYLIEETYPGIVNVADVDLGEEDKNGIPIAKENADGCTFRFFFSRLADDGG